MPAKAGCPVVGIGSSAGGLEALEALFRAAPADSGLAFVVVTHLPSGRESALPVILGRFTPMPVVAARDGEAVQPNHVYVAPADVLLTIRDHTLRLQKADPAHREPHPIDHFLGSLAEDQAERAIAIILSGSGSDGTLGLMAVKERGGLTVVQGGDHSAPRHTGMPSSAISSGSVDLVLPAEAIPAKLQEYLRSFDALEELVAEPERPAENKKAVGTREAICAILRQQVGHDFAGYKERTFMRRVQRRMQVLELIDVDAYVDRLRQDAGEASLLFRDLLIGVTNFFRDKEAFEALERLVIPRLFEGKGAEDTIRVWVPGCATGEEVFSIAILIREHMDRLKAQPKVQIFASDIDEKALRAARTAHYPKALLAEMAPERLKRFFTPEGDGAVCLLSKQVRDMCVFSAHSLIRDPPFSHLDLISCRNLLIYLGAELQSRVIPLFHYALKPGGFLFLGSAENVTRYGDLFALLDRKAHLFQRRDHAGPQLPFELVVSNRRFPPFATSTKQPPVASGPTLRRAVEAEVLERYAPAHVVVNRDGEAVYHSPRTGKYLDPPVGQPTRQVLAMARKGLRLDLRMALQEAIETRAAVTRDQVAIELDTGHVQIIQLTVAPLPEREYGGPLFLILFVDQGAPRPADWVLASQPLPAESAALLERLERELKDTRERLQSSIEEHESSMEELKSANEELVSLNEELQSTNEELETSKEEIQSINEELQTVNQELGAKVDQLNRANSDLRNLFDSTRVGVVFLDQQLVIRSYTPPAAELFSLLPADRGRPLADLSSQLDHAGLQEDLKAVLASGEPIERRLGRRDNQVHYLMRVLPYRDEGTTDGIVITFFEITRIVEAEQRQQVLIHELNHRVRNMLSVVGAVARQTVARSPSLAAFTDAFLGRIDALARSFGLLAREQWGEVTLEEVLCQELEPYLAGGEDRVTLKGPRVMLQSRAAVGLGMAIHELATNAVKYGALSAPGGRVSIEWHIEERQEGRCLRLSWQESGGPPVRAPEMKGFGSELIEREIGHDLDGEVRIEFRKEGVVTRMLIPWRRELLA